MYNIRGIEFRDSGSITNTKICFIVRATALRPRLHIEGFPLYVHTGLPTQGTSLRIWQIKSRSTQLLSPTTQPLHKRLGTTIITSTLKGMGTKPNNDHLSLEG